MIIINYNDVVVNQWNNDLDSYNNYNDNIDNNN